MLSPSHAGDVTADDSLQQAYKSSPSHSAGAGRLCLCHDSCACGKTRLTALFAGLAASLLLASLSF